jgi:DsbC/DsbD-like thiol-disulfide interchange protein
MAPHSRAILVASLALISAVTFGQGDTPPVVKLSVDTPIVAASKPFKATLTVTFGSGLHAYQNPQSDPSYIPVAVTSGDKVFKIVAVNYPKGTPTTIAGEKTPINVYTGTIKIPITLQAPAKFGRMPLKVAFAYQQCNDSSCFPPSSITALGTVTVSPKAGKSVSPTSKSSQTNR